MDLPCVIEHLAKIANEFDRNGRYVEADQITTVMTRLAGPHMRWPNIREPAINFINHFKLRDPSFLKALTGSGAAAGIGGAAMGHEINNRIPGTPEQTPPAGGPLNNSGQSQQQIINQLLQEAANTHYATGNGWQVINDAIARNNSLTPESKQTLKQEFAIKAETLKQSPPPNPSPLTSPTVK